MGKSRGVWSLAGLISCFMMVLTVVCLVAASTGYAGKMRSPRRAPMNSDFLNSRAGVDSGVFRGVSEDGYSLGYFPPPVELSPGIGIDSNVSEAPETALPVAYDLRKEGRVTPVRDQGECGSCWAFATYGSLESWLLRQPSPESRDFSEEDLNHNHGFDPGDCAGGNFLMSAAYLTRWSGPVSEKDVPYPYFAPADAGVPVAKHVQEVAWLPARDGFTANNTIKAAIMRGGAVSCSFEYSPVGYNPDLSTYWYPLSSPGNHAVTIVGWDDTILNTNFNEINGKVPEGNGAFLVKNSWGSGWGDEGYFYISYYDRSLTNFVSFAKAWKPTVYTRLYEYDPLGWVRSVGFGGETAWFSNIFMAGARDTTIKGVGFYTRQAGCPYEIYIYKEVKAKNPVSGKLVKTVKGTMAYAGYHTVNLSAPAEVTGGERFSVVVKLTTRGYGFPVAVEEPLDGYSRAAKAAVGESFLGSDGKGWTDITDWPTYENTNVCLKAYAGRL